MSYYSKVAEVNAAGDLSGDETTQSGTSASSDDEDGGGLLDNAKKEVDDEMTAEEGEKRANRSTLDSHISRETIVRNNISAELSFKDHSHGSQGDVPDILSARSIYAYFSYELVFPKQEKL